MMCCFGSIARAPLAVMLMVAEMTGTLTLVVPAMVAVGLATLIVHRSDDTIYRSQLRSRAESPAHRILTGLPLVVSLRASEAMAVPRCVLRAPVTVASALRQMEASGVEAAPFIDEDGRYVGVVSLEALRDAGKGMGGGSAGDMADSGYVPVHAAARLDDVLDTVTSTPQSWAAVVDGERRVIGTIAISDIVRSYRRTVLTTLRKVSELGGSTGLADVVVASRAPIAGRSLRSARLPRGLLVTAVERDQEVITPSGDTIVRAGDRLMALGGPEDLDRLKGLAAVQPATEA